MFPGDWGSWIGAWRGITTANSTANFLLYHFFKYALGFVFLSPSQDLSALCFSFGNNGGCIIKFTVILWSPRGSVFMRIFETITFMSWDQVKISSPLQFNKLFVPSSANFRGNHFSIYYISITYSRLKISDYSLLLLFLGFMILFSYYNVKFGIFIKYVKSIFSYSIKNEGI